MNYFIIKIILISFGQSNSSNTDYPKFNALPNKYAYMQEHLPLSIPIMQNMDTKYMPI